MTRRLLGLLLLVSFALRVWLASRGGQNFWPDESRYGASRSAAAALSSGHVRDALKDLFAHVDHVLLRPAALPAALVEHALGGEHPFIVSCYFALFSVGVILMVWALARRAGAPEKEALWAAFLTACSNSLFLYSRFFLPYDIALFVILGALWLALGTGSRLNSLAVGCVAALGLLTYNGYWLLAGTVLGLYALRGRGGLGRLPSRAAFATLGLVATVGAVLALGDSLSSGLLRGYSAFSASVTQGDFGIGYRLIPEYLWHAEHLVGVAWLGAIAYAAACGGPGRWAGRLGWWIGGLAGVLAGLVLFSDVLPRFVVYGRLVRSAIPYACLGAAFGIRFVAVRARVRARGEAALALLLGACACANFAGPLGQTFPLDFLRASRAALAGDAGHGYPFYRALFAETLWGRPLHFDLPSHKDLLARPNPMAYRPYQYEGYSAAAREGLNRYDVTMRFARLEPALAPLGASWSGYPGPVRLRTTFDPEGGAEPLYTSGVPPRADIVFVRYLDPGHVAFGLDHWGSQTLISDPVEVDFGRPHDLVLSAGSLLPPEGSPAYAGDPGLVGLRRQLVVLLDGHAVLSRAAEFHPSEPANIHFGVNLVGASSTRVDFTGTVSSFTAEPVESVASLVPAVQIARLADRRPPEWAGALGPLRLRFRLPPAGTQGQPLLAIGGPAASDLLYVVRDGSSSFRVGFDSRGRALLVSEPLAASPSGLEVLDVSLGSMLPAVGAPLYRRVPEFERMRGEVYVRRRGEPVLSAERGFEPAAPRWIFVGQNVVDSSVCGPLFQGEVERLTALGPDNFPFLGNRLSDLMEAPPDRPSDPPGPLCVRLRFPAGRPGATETLLASGVGAATDRVFVTYLDRTHGRLGYAHGGEPPVLSAPLSLEPGKPRELLISLGSLVPSPRDAEGDSAQDLARLRSVAAIDLDGRPVLFLWKEAFASPTDHVGVGSSSPTGAVDPEPFQGTLESVRPEPAGRLLEVSGLDPRLERPGWDGYTGPLRLRVVFPEVSGGVGQPLLTSGVPGAGDFLFLKCDSAGSARIVQDHWGAPLVASDPFPVEPGSVHELEVSLGMLMPPAGASLYREHPELLVLRERTLVRLDGRVILSAAQACHPTPSSRILLGTNFIGGSSTQSIFDGTVTDVSLAPADPLRW